MFDKVVCLNIDKRWAHREPLAAEAAKRNLKVEFFLAGDGKTLPPENYDHLDIEPPAMRFGYPAWVKRPNSYNAFLCFRKIITQAQHDKCESLLLLEDDATFCPEFDPIFPLAQAQLPADWDLFYLGANHAFARPIPFSDNLLRLTGGSLCFHAVALRHTIFQRILDLPMYGPIDDMVAKRLQAHVNTYACWPNIIWPMAGFSYCEGTNVSYDHYKDKKSQGS